VTLGWLEEQEELL